MKIATIRYETEKFNRKNDFSLWRIKIKVLLTHQGLEEALEPTIPDEKLTEKQFQISKKAHSAIILNLDDKVLSKVARRIQPPLCGRSWKSCI